MSLKSYFRAYLENRVSDYHSVSSYSFLYICGRCELYFMAIGSTVFRFDPPNPKNWVLESLWVEKAVFVNIGRTVCPITIPFIPKVFFRCVGGVSHVSCVSDQQFEFWPSKSKKLSSWKPMSWKSCFRAYLENCVFDSHSISSYNFL